MKFLVWASATLFLAVTAVAQQKINTRIDPHAERILRAACQYLAEAPFYSLNAEIWRDHVDSDGQKVQFTRVMDLEVKRPDRLHADIHSPHTQREFWYDGKSLTVLDGKRSVFSTAEMPATLDQAIDAAHDQFGIDLPMIDLAISDPFKNAMSKVITARYFGLASAMGYSCHHLAFTQENIDWQVWIQDGPQPLIRKFVITHKNEEGSPEFTGLIREWNFTSRISESDFVFEQPPGTLRIQMQNVQTGETGVPKPTGQVEPRSR
jgi:hypothetical protein